MKIDKSHSKTDLIELINTLNLPVINSHQDNKKSIQIKIIQSLELNLNFTENVYNIHNTNDLRAFLMNPNPKKSLNVKEKKDLMMICKKIIHYCKNDYCLYKSQYKTLQEIDDDMNYIKQFGDLPSVRRACRLMNENIMSKIVYEPLISPQVRKQLDEKEKLKNRNIYHCHIRKGPFTIKFD